MKIAFVHIAKSAGSSVNKVFSELLGPENCAFHIESNPRWVKSNELDPVIESNIFVSGHRTYLDFQAHLDLTERYVFTFLREPRSHVVSHLAWIRKLAEPEERNRFLAHPLYIQELALKLSEVDFTDEMSLAHLFSNLTAQEFSLLDNPHVRYFRQHEEDRVRSSDVSSALENLDKINYVGLVETFQKDLSFILRDLGFECERSASKAPRENVRDGFAEISTENNVLIDSVKDLIRHDLQLYNEIYKRRLSSIDRFKGRLDGLVDGKLFGWAQFQGSDRAVNLDVFIDRNFVGTVSADKYRKDLHEKFNKNCAFEYFLDAANLDSSSIISVRLAGERAELENSPICVARR